MTSNEDFIEEGPNLSNKLPDSSEKMTTIFSLIENLTKEEKKAAYDYVAFQAITTTKDPLTRAQSNFLDAVLIATNSMPVTNLTGQGQYFIKTYGRRAFNDKAAIAESFVIHSVAIDTKYIVRAAVMTKSIAALAKFIRRQKIICTPAALLNNINLIDQAIDVQFPNYAESRLLHMIVKPMYGGAEASPSDQKFKL